MLAELLEDEEIDFAEEENLIDFYTGDFVEELKILAASYLVNFFKDREMHCGGNIPRCLLCSDQNISMVLNTNLEKGIKRAYKGIELNGNIATETENESLVAEDIKLVVAIIKGCAIAKVPPEFIPGIVLLYLEYCEGIEFAF